VLIDQAEEIDDAQPLIYGDVIFVAISKVIEEDTAQPIKSVKKRMIGIVVETNIAQSILQPQIIMIGQVVEIDTAQHITLVEISDVVFPRAYIIPYENRVYIIPAEEVQVDEERIYVIPAENRVLEIK